MRTRSGQKGISILGFIFVAAVVLSVAMIGFRVFPSYIEYLSVQKALKEMLEASRDGQPLQTYRSDFDRRANAGYIDSVRGSDVDVAKEGNQVVATASWTKTLPLVGNASLLLDFQATATK
ncbi:MAG TPA: DUF4845 domain-containing protein [Casimicrobiaceae bacterium]|nr:DUF4845 domain-containing protein [Casimicrobiaceae bacterium]